MRESIHKFFQVGTIQWMSYPDRDVAEGVRAIARDDFFDAIEISQIADDGKREEVKRLLEQSHLRVCYGAQPRLLGTGLNPNDTDEEGRRQAEATLLEAIDEAEYVLDAIAGYDITYPVVFDWEPPIPSESLPAEDLRAYDMEGEVITAMAGTFCQAIQKGGYDPCVYTNKSMAYNTFNLEELKDFPLWYAEYQPAPSLYYHFQMWQYSASGTVPGIAGSVDLNICFEPY